MTAQIISMEGWRNAPRKIVRRTRIVSDAKYEREIELDEELQRAKGTVEFREHLIERAPKDYAEAQARIDLGVFIGGPKKGQPLSAQRRKTLEQERDRWLKFRDEQVANLPIVNEELAKIQAKAKAEGIL